LQAAILYNLKDRHVQSLPYTRTGDIVLAVNPYQWFHDLYSWKQRQLYSQALVWNTAKSEGKVDPRTFLRPHVYEASSLAYKGLYRNGEDQSILVSGESGAGKTETVKILLGDLAEVQKGAPSSNSSSSDDNDIVQRVLDSNPLLEAFGNAQTLRNDNSSRFGKFLQLQFDRQPSKCILAGSKCEVYLLEKSRVTMHHPEERSYHIFYQLLAAPPSVKKEIWEPLEDADVECFDYIGWSNVDTIEGKTDAERFQLTVEALRLIGLSQETLLGLWRAICIVLQLGNLEFEPTSDDECKVSSQEELTELSDLMGVSIELLTKAFTIRNVKAKSEKFQVYMTADKAKESTDAFAKEIYAKTFLWLVRTINDATCAEKNYSPRNEYGIIGLLDIFGFESFEVNRFEQLCINYANEKLQQKFTQDIFQSVQEEYEMEGIELEEITYDDNTDVLDLVEGKMGLLAFLNEECVRPKGSDKTFVYKAQASNGPNPCFFRDLHAPDCQFGIRHYAGSVVYDATNFVTTNTDTLPQDLLECASLSTNPILSNELDNDGTTNTFSSASKSTNKKKRRPKTSLGVSKLVNRRNSNIAAETVWTKFKNQLGHLMDALSDTQTRYIRCIKPNAHKKPLLMEHVSTVNQLRYAGVVAAVTISRSAFPNRLEHLIVLERFKSLWPKGDHIKVLNDIHLDPDERIYKAVEILLNIALKDMESEKQEVKVRAFVMGKTRAYFRAGALEFLEGERLRYLGKFAVTIQTSVRTFVARTKFVRYKHALIALQSYHRQGLQRKVYQTQKCSAISVQCWYRTICAAQTIYHLRRKKKSTMIQTRWRIRTDQRRFLKLKAASIVIETMVRGSLQRPKYRQALKEKKEEAKLENQLVALQKKLEEAETKRIEAEKEAEARAAAAVEQYKEEQENEAPEQDKNPPGSPSKSKQVDGASIILELQPEDGSEYGSEGDHTDLEEQNAEQQKLMDESGKMLEYLRKEVFKLRSQNQQLRTDFDLLKDNNQRLMDANASAGASFAALNQHAKQLSKQNAQLVNEVSSAKSQVQKLDLLQAELKEESRMKQLTYVGEVQSRFQYQKALQKITDLIEANCRDHRLVQKVLEITDEVEMEAMIAGDSPGPTNSNNESRSSIFSYLNPFG
jgi:myosin-5